MTCVVAVAPRPIRFAVFFPCLVAWTAASSEAETFRVGDDGIPPCTHATLPAAVAAAAANGTSSDQIYLSDPVTLSSPLMITDQSLLIIGGFSSCTDDDPETSRTTVTVATNDAIFVSGGTSLRFVTLRNLSILRPSANPPGRLLRIEDDSFVILANSRLVGGEADAGGNVFMSGGGTYLSIAHHLEAASEISGGEATLFGGGIYCEEGGTVELASGAIRRNHAEFDGGGVYLNGCSFTQFDGQSGNPDCDLPGGGRGTICNRAERFGGGIYASGGSEVRLVGNATRPALLFDNQAEQGGGIYLFGPGTTAEGENAWIIDNDAWLIGGGALVRSSASLTLETTASNCARAHCSLVEGNFAVPDGAGGAFAADAGGDLTILQTTITGNLAGETGGVADASGAGTTVLLEGCLVHDNDGGQVHLDSREGAMITAAFSTIDEVGGSMFDTNSGSTVRIYSSILLPEGETPGSGKIFAKPIVAGETRVADCVLFNESPVTLPSSPDPGSHELITDIAALFANWAARDLRLTAGSQAIDFCDTFNYTPVTTDIERQTRGFDVLTIPDGPFGPFDLGADEWLPLLVADHEEGNCDDWSSDTGGC